MKLIRKDEGVEYDAALHFNVWCQRKLGAGIDTDKLFMGITHFLPSGKVDMSGGPSEKAYFIISGAMIIKTGEGEFTLTTGDIAYFPPHEEREITIPGSEACVAMVCLVKAPE